jgi:Na+/H+ antiporter NhaC
MEYGILSLAIPLLTICLAIITKDVIVSLIGGVFIGLLVLNAYNPLSAFFALLDGVIGLLAEGWIAKTLLFALMIGAIIRIFSDAQALTSFVAWIALKSQKIDSPRGAMLLAYALGVFIFIESSITALISGTVAKPLCDKHGISREKLAYICDSTSAPICSLIPLNAWGALLLGLIVTAIDAEVISGDGVSLLIASIPYNFYAIFTLIIVLIVIIYNKDLGEMRHSKAVPYIAPTIEETPTSSPLAMLLPLGVMILSVPLGLYFTGKGDIFQGSGSTSVYYAVSLTLLFMYLYYIPSKRLSHKAYFKSLYEGMAEMLPITVILLFALFIGKVIGELGTADYLSTLLNHSVPAFLIPLLLFWVSAMTSFSTGTSWGTFSIMMPIALALGATMGLPLPLVIASVISGGIFGDHASPISDTTIISSMASGCEPIAHVRTQFPYAMIAGGLSSLAFLFSAWVML